MGTLEKLGKSKAEIEDQPDLRELHERRTRTIDWIDATNAKRDPPPAISRSKVEALNSAFEAWRREADARDAKRDGNSQNPVRFRPAVDYSNLPQYERVEEMFCELTMEERAALLALGWYAQERGVADWPGIYDRAINMVTTYDTGKERIAALEGKNEILQKAIDRVSGNGRIAYNRIMKATEIEEAEEVFHGFLGQPQKTLEE